MDFIISRQSPWCRETVLMHKAREVGFRSIVLS
jgi:hypothetical protein